MSWEIVIGLEVHAELATKSKIFCGCTTEFGGEPNSHVCPVCSGMPGTLPKLNRAVVEYAVLLGLTLNCGIERNCKFDRKNYFYPDLPKAYQISQLYAPICHDGYLELEVSGEAKKIGIREIHMEEDAGKLIHHGRETLMDFNRCGVPLLEIVSLPDFRGASEAVAYLERLREILVFLGVSDGKMQEGSLRCDVNLSVRRPGGELGTRTEMKNLNSFKAACRAIEFEAARQISILERGGAITQETRRWIDEKGESQALRSKENAQDYRYFPEPDLLPIYIDENWLETIKSGMPELAHQKRERYIRDYGVSSYEAAVLTSHSKISELFEKIAAECKNAAEAAHLVTGEIMHLMNAANILPENLSANAAKLAYLVRLVTEGKISRNAYKEAIDAVFSLDVEPEAYISQNGLFIKNDGDAVTEAVNAALSENPGAVKDYRDGKDRAFGYIMGQAMKKLGNSANPEAVRIALTDIFK